MTPKVSIIIPLYNRAHAIGRTLRSIPVDDAARAGEVEIIVVDDGSSDGGAAVAEAEAGTAGLSGIVTVLRQANAGAGAARNTGAARARGQLLAFLDSDDMWRPGTLDALRRLAAEADDMALGFLRIAAVRDAAAAAALDSTAPMGLTRVESFLVAATTPGVGSGFGSGSVVIPRTLFLDVGGFTTAVRCSEDSDLFLRLSGRGACWITEGPALVANITGGADRLSGNGACVRDGVAHLLREAASGAYGDPGARLDRFLARGVVYACRLSFAAGQAGPAYRFLARHGWRLGRGGQGRWLWRLALYPVLGRLRPQSYPLGPARP